MDNSTLKALIRASNGPLAVLFSCLLLQSQEDRTYFGEDDIVRVMGRTHKTIRAHLRQLAQLGFITRTKTRGYILTYMGRQQLLEVAHISDPGNLNDGEICRLDSGESVKTTDRQWNHEAGLPVKITGLTSEVDEDVGENPEKRNHEVGLPVKTTDSDVVVVYNNNNLNSQQQQTTAPVNFTGADLVREIGVRLCRGAGPMLGDEIWPERVVPWLVQSYNTTYSHQGLSVLAGWMAQMKEHPPAQVRSSRSSIVAANLLAGRKPARQYLEHYWDYFPDALLENLFEIIECVECWQVECVCDDQKR